MCVCIVYICVCVRAHTLCEVGVLRGQMFPRRSLEELGKCVVMSFALVAWVQEREKRDRRDGAAGLRGGREVNNFFNSTSDCLLM